MRIINVTSKHITLDAKSRTYGEKKVQKLVDYIPRHARKSATAELKIEKIETKGSSKIEAEIILTLPDKKLVAKEQLDGVLAAIDGAEQKILGQIRRYKTERQRGKSTSGNLISKIKRSLRRRK